MRKLTDKRRVTLPQTICTAIGLHPGDYVDIFARNGTVHIVKIDTRQLAEKNHTPPSAESIETACKTRATDNL